MNYKEAKLISELLVSVIAKSMGYNFPQDRIERIAQSSRELRKEGCASLLSVAAAFELDLLLYGNPLKEVPIIGILNATAKEAYGDQIQS